MGITINLPNIHSDGNRAEVIACADAAVERYSRAASCTGIEVPPRVGKSSIARIIALECTALGAPFVHYTAPWKNLVTQILDNEKTEAFRKHYGVTVPLIRDEVRNPRHHLYYKRLGCQPFMLASTINLVHANIDNVVNAVYDGIETTGKRPVFILDETHIIARAREFGATVEKLMKAGAYIVSMTGTPIRLDKGNIPGFERERVSEAVTSSAVRLKSIVNNGDGTVTRTMARGESERVDIQIKPVGSTPVPWGAAFDNRWLMPCNIVKLDFDIPQLGVKLSEARLKDLRLADITRSEECINRAVFSLMSRLATLRKQTGKRIKALIITGSDLESKGSREEKKFAKEEANFHARSVRRAIEEYIDAVGTTDARSLCVEIATTTTDNGEPDDKAADRIESFRKGATDILIVKMMGLVGLDVPECKIVVNLSPMRNGPLFIQASTRGLTPGDGFNIPGDLIMPWDEGAQELAEFFREANGIVTTDSFSEQEEFSVTTKIEPPVDNTQTAENGHIAGYHDQDGNNYDGDMEEYLAAVKVKFAVIVKGMTDAVILGGMKVGAFPVTDEELEKFRLAKKKSVQAENLSERREELDGDISTRAKEIASAYFSYQNNLDEWREMLRSLYNRSKVMAGLPMSIKIPDIDDPAQIAAILDALNKIDAAQMAKEITTWFARKAA